MISWFINDKFVCVGVNRWGGGNILLLRIDDNMFGITALIVTLFVCSVCQVIGMYDYTAQNDDELPFGKGQIINVLSREDPDWWKGELNGSVGLFPSNYVKLTTDTDPSQQCEYE